MSTPQPRPWILREINYGYIKENPYQVAVLAMGATEPHNLHLPYGTDAFEGEAIGSRACELAWQRGAKVVLLPTMPYGTETNMMEFPLAMNLNPSTLTRVISDIVDSLAKHKVLKLVILNSHGGNDFKPVLRELTDKTPGERDPALVDGVKAALRDRARVGGDFPGDVIRRDEMRFEKLNQ